MIFIHQYTGEWSRLDWLNPTREPYRYREWTDVQLVDDPVAKELFEYMLEKQVYLVNNGSHIYQIRK